MSEAKVTVSHEVINLKRETYFIGRQLLLPNGRMRVPAGALDENTTKQLVSMVKEGNAQIVDHDAAGDADLLKRMADASAKHNAARAARAAATANQAG